MDMTRKDFIWLTVVGLGGLAAGCGPDRCKDGANATITANHGHALAVPAADFGASAEKTYDIQGTSTHPHQITLTPAAFQTLKDGGSVTVDSTTFTNSTGASHIHAVTLSCMAA